jgi:D-alanyl-D-alanine carboxypeptidase (penicillin-binding protein 5/6)
MRGRRRTLSRRSQLAVLAFVVAAAAAWPHPAAALRFSGYGTWAGPPPPLLAAASVLVVDDRTGKAVFAINADERRAMASTTKIMTGLIAAEHETNPNAVVVITHEAAVVGEATIYLKPGQRWTVNQLMVGLFVASANDAAVALADHISGNEARFVALMNRRAQLLGLADTHFENANGLDAPGHYTTARDLTRLARVAMRNPRFAAYVHVRHAELPWPGHPKPLKLTNHNTLLIHYGWIDGVKTGWTNKAGYCIVAHGTYGGASLYVTLLGEPSWWRREKDAVALFRYASALYRSWRSPAPGSTLRSVSLPYVPRRLDVVVDRSISTSVPPGETVRTEVKLADRVRTPVHRGEVLGTVSWSMGKLRLGDALLVAGRSVDKPGWWGRMGARVVAVWGYHRPVVHAVRKAWDWTVAHARSAWHRVVRAAHVAWDWTVRHVRSWWHWVVDHVRRI